MSISPHRIAHDLYRGPKHLADPGNGGIIRPNADLQVCEMTSGASAETRTLANPTKPGIRFILRLLTDGGGVVVVNAPNGLNAVPEVSATFADAGDMLSLISVSLTATTYRWETLVQTGVALATATSTASATATATSTSTGTPTSTSTSTSTASSTSTRTASSTSTSTQSISGSDTASGTFSASATSTGTATGTSTGTATATGTSTSTPSKTSTKTSTSTASPTATATGTQ